MIWLPNKLFMFDSIFVCLVDFFYGRTCRNLTTLLPGEAETIHGNVPLLRSSARSASSAPVRFLDWSHLVSRILAERLNVEFLECRAKSEPEPSHNECNLYDLLPACGYRFV